MRKELKDLGENARYTFTGTFERYGKKTAFKGPALVTLLFRDVKYNGEIVSDHLWFTMTKGFEKLDLKTGDVIQFDGRVELYEKGYCGRRDDDEIYLNHPIEEDYKISRPTKISVILRAEREQKR